MQINLDDYDYDLPPERIAQEPAARREESRLLVLDRTRPDLQLGRFLEIGSYLREGDLLVLNDTRVFPARLFGRRETGGRVEVFMLSPLSGEPPRWCALLRPARAGRSGGPITLEGAPDVQVRPVTEEAAGTFQVELHCQREILSGNRVLELCEEVGEVPLPPYIERQRGDGRRELDRERYQTVYARSPGAVAAPTAGLHFTEELLGDLRSKGILTVSVTLTVGLGTFRPIRQEELQSGRLFREPVAILSGAAEQILLARREGRRVVAVGTTAARALESWALAGKPIVEGTVGWSSSTDLLIAEGHRFELVDALLTNFHLPRSSLLLLVSALAGRGRVLEAYRHAVKEGFRFYSYGDAMLVT